MIEEITFGISVFALGLGACWAALKMTRGPVYYYGKTIQGGRPVEARQLNGAETYLPTDAAVLIRYFLDAPDEFVSRTEVASILAAALLANRNKKRHERAELDADSVLDKLEAKGAEANKKNQDPTSKCESGTGESQKWKDDVERRLRALEERSAEEGSMFAMGDSPALVTDVDRIH